MSKLRISFVERKFEQFVSIEKVFRTIAAALDKSRFESSFQPLNYSNGLVGTIRNLMSFRSDPHADIYHVTGHCHYIALLLPPERTVLTIHDLVFLHTRRGLRRWVLKKLLLDMPLRRLKYVTVISDSTKREVEAAVPGARAAMRVIPNPLDDSARLVSRKPFDQNEPSILQIGTSPNKNVANLVTALRGIACTLTIIGRIDNELERLIAENKIRHRVLFDLSDAEIRGEYEKADIVAFCSTYEGFGLPIIEAQASGKPVLTSNLSPMTEVSGEGGAMLVDPFETESIRRGIMKIIEEEVFREELVQNGLENVKRFDKSIIASQYAEVYEEVVSAGSRPG